MVDALTRFLSQFKFPAFASIRSSPDDFHSSPTYFTQDRERSDREVSDGHKGFVRPLESSGFFSRSASHMYQNFVTN